MFDKLMWIGLAVVFLVIFPTVGIIVLALLAAAVMAGGASGSHPTV
jgi:hypothetical protein